VDGHEMAAKFLGLAVHNKEMAAEPCGMLAANQPELGNLASKLTISSLPHGIPAMSRLFFALPMEFMIMLSWCGILKVTCLDSYLVVDGK